MNDMRASEFACNRDKVVIDLEGAISVVEKLAVNSHGRRLVVGIGGFPASGKTTAAKALVKRISQNSGKSLAAHLPMDGFHLTKDQLAAKDFESVKGCIATYDLCAYLGKIRSYRSSLGLKLSAPDYSREIHDVLQDKIVILEEVCVLVTEGIYVGYSEGDWKKLRDLLDIVFYLDALPERCAERIVARNLEAGRSEDMIMGKLRNDFKFMEISLQILPEADYVIRLSL